MSRRKPTQLFFSSPSLFAALLAGLVLGGGPLLASVERVPFATPLLWPEDQRAFLQDGPGLLLSDNEIDDLLSLDAIGREEYILRYLDSDPLPETPENELLEAIRRRQILVRHELNTFLDDRARLLFLHGTPSRRTVVDCAETFKPLEIWTYSHRERSDRLVVYRPKPEVPWRLWLPIDSKRSLYNPEMEYWLQQWEELRGRIRGGKRFDRQICDFSEEVDEATGVDGLFGFQPDRPKNDAVRVYLQPPDDLAAWAERAVAGEPPSVEYLDPAEIELLFPERKGLRIVSQAVVKFPAGSEFEPFEDGERKELRFTLEGHLERDAQIFERFRMRFQLPFPDGRPLEESRGPTPVDAASEEPVPEDRVSEGSPLAEAAPENGTDEGPTTDEPSSDAAALKSAAPVALIGSRNLRPSEDFLLRLKLIEETSGKETYVNRGFVVPREPRASDHPTLSEEAIVAIGQDLGKQCIAGYDSLILVPPETDVVFGLWRAEALVTGTRIIKVSFLLDGQPVMSRHRPPFTAELRLATYPTEQIVKAEGYDEQSELVAEDEVIVNQPRGELRVRVLEPERGKPVVAGPVTVRAEVVVPEEKRVTEVQVLLNDELQAALDKPPWETSIEMPPTGELTYLTITAELDDGSKAEAVSFLNAPNYMEEVDVNLVELYTTVSDKSGRLVRGLAAAEFKVWEDGRPQPVAKFELVEDLPLTLGITIDTSGSMFESLGEAQRAAIDFLENIITPRDRCFALAFSDRPQLLMPRTSDVGAVAERVQDLVASGSTSLHDAIVTSLYYYRGIRGRRALVVLSDGEDTSSSLGFAEALEYAKRSGVAVFTIGLRIGKLQVGIRRKLENLAEQTGGRTFYISEAAELFTVYDEIEAELRSQYLVAYTSDQGDKDGYREVMVKVKDGKLKARTIRGYYQ